MEALARRAVACPKFRWMGGTRWVVYAEIHGSRYVIDFGRLDETYDPVPKDALPDLSDPATLGCLLALVREAHESPIAHTRWSRSRAQWAVSIRHDILPGLDGPTEAAALVAALEAAP